MTDKVNEDGQNVDENGNVIDPKSHPENVSWTQYVGIKEKFTRVETELNTKVTSLEEQLKTAVSSADHTKVQGELDTVKAELTKVNSELKIFKDSSLAEKKTALETKGVPKDKLETLTEAELIKLNDVLATVNFKEVKPKADLGSGGGGGPLTGKPMELARQAYASSNK